MYCLIKVIIVLFTLTFLLEIEEQWLVMLQACDFGACIKIQPISACKEQAADRVSGHRDDVI